jgi:hypothetical protein
MELLSIYDAQTEILRWLETLGHEVIYDMPFSMECNRCKLHFDKCSCPDNPFRDLNLERDEILKRLEELAALRRAIDWHSRADAGPVHK